MARLDAALSADKRGCLTTGDYGSSTSRLDLTKGGTVGHPATITAANGASPVIHGYFEIHASNLTLSNIKWDLNLIQGRTQHTGCSTTAAEGVDIEASNVTFTHNEVTAQNAPLAQRDNGIGVAWNTTVTGVVITYNKIHDFGSCNQFDHGIYYDHASNGTIANNWIWNGPCSYGTGGGDHTRGCGAGIQLYSDPSNNQVFNNVIDGTGVAASVTAPGTTSTTTSLPTCGASSTTTEASSRGTCSRPTVATTSTTTFPTQTHSTSMRQIRTTPSSRLARPPHGGCGQVEDVPRAER